MCHVQGCAGNAVDLQWHPAYGCIIGLCKKHFQLADREQQELMIDLRRAKEDHEKNMDAWEGQLRKQYG